MKIRRNNTGHGTTRDLTLLITFDKKDHQNLWKKQKEKQYRLTTLKCLHAAKAADAACSTWQRALPHCVHQTAKYGRDLHLQLQQSTTWQTQQQEPATPRHSLHKGINCTKALHSLDAMDILGATNERSLFFFLDSNSTQSQTQEMCFGTRSETSM